MIVNYNGLLKCSKTNEDLVGAIKELKLINNKRPKSTTMRGTFLNKKSKALISLLSY